jgi:LPXTG-motif cell wall-anchored protein
MKRYMLCSLVLLVLIGFLPLAEASHLPVTETDLATITLGGLIAGPTADDFLFVHPGTGVVTDVGDIVNEVYFNDVTDIYTYIHEVTPEVDNVSEINTAFVVLGFNGIGGWSFSDASTAGGAGDDTDITLVLDTDDTLDWTDILPNDSFDSLESIRFFFQSTNPPALGGYNLLNTNSGFATSYAPTPEPGSVAAIAGIALFGLIGWFWRRRK